MPQDLTMCIGQTCPLKANCLRHTGAVNGKWDSFVSLPFDFNANHCEYYIDDRPPNDKTKNLAYILWEKEGYKQGLELHYWFEAENKLIREIRNS